jgi:subtilisin family serine protease
MMPPIAVTVPPKDLTEAPGDWHRLDYETDGVLGVGSERAIRELLAGRRPQREVIVAVIDGGTDTLHTLLRPNLWRNPKERPDGQDNDGNGLVDDVYGWNLIGGASGSVHHDTYEVTRVYAACRNYPAGKGTPRPDEKTCGEVAKAYGEKKTEIQQTLAQINQISTVLTQVTRVLTEAVGAPLTKAKVDALNPTTPQLTQAKQLWSQLAANGLDEAEIAEAKKAYDGQFKYGLDTMFDARSVVGDDLTAVGDRRYGNTDIMGADASHGTHVAGIIAAVRGSGPMQGIAPNTKIMTLRTVPDGDERDKDVANAIRYAVDNGAHIINMSFGKAYSPNRAAVDEAVKYAESKGVLLVHAAGNDAKNNDSEESYPTPKRDGGARPSNWLEVGASSWKGMRALPAEFSNYGKATVDIFAPGVDVLSAVPGGGTKPQSGTSMAAPVVSGVAALLMAYFPDLNAVQVKDLILRSSRSLADVDVGLPGAEGTTVKFGTLSRTGGVINAYAAVKMALDIRP